MIDSKILHNFEPMWSEQIADYALIDLGEDKSGEKNYVIWHAPTSNSLIIEDDALFDEVKRRMLAAGVQIINVKDLKDLLATQSKNRSEQSKD